MARSRLKGESCTRNYRTTKSTKNKAWGFIETLYVHSDEHAEQICSCRSSSFAVTRPQAHKTISAI
jgi:hypothetical protein